MITANQIQRMYEKLCKKLDRRRELDKEIEKGILSLKILLDLYGPKEKKS